MTGPIFDTHAHYSSRAFDADRFALLDSLPDKGVVGVCEQATHSGDAPRVLELAHRYPWVVAAIGIHPESLLPAADCGEEGPERHDSGCTEQAWGEINQNPCNNLRGYCRDFCIPFSYPKSCGHK